MLLSAEAEVKQPRRKRRKTADEQGLADEYRDFKRFLILVWRNGIIPANPVTGQRPNPTRVQLDIADFLQYGGSKLCVMSMRGIGKSYIGAALALWTLAWNRDAFIVVISKKFDKAKEITRFMLDTINTVPELRFLKPTSNDRTSTVSFDVAGKTPSIQPSVKAYGIEGMITGSRATLVIADDVETDENCETDIARATLDRKTTDFINFLLPDVGRIVYFGTPQCAESLYTTVIPARGGYNIRAWPILYPDGDLIKHLGPWLAPMYLTDLAEKPSLEGTAIDTRLNDKHAKAQMEEGMSMFRLQNMLDTRAFLGDVFPLKLSQISVWDPDVRNGQIFVHENLAHSSAEGNRDHSLPSLGIGVDGWYRAIVPPGDQGAMVPLGPRVMTIDPSGRGEDETAYTISAARGAHMFLLESGGFMNGSAPETLEGLVDAAQRNRVGLILIEVSGIGEGIRAALLPVLRARFTEEWRCACDDIKEHVDWRNTLRKEPRMLDALEPFFHGNRLFVARSVITRDLEKVHSGEAGRKPSAYRLFRQVTHLSRAKDCLAHDDAVDALAMACAYHRSAVLPASNIERAQISRDEQQARAIEALRKYIERSPVTQGALEESSAPSLLDCFDLN